MVQAVNLKLKKAWLKMLKAYAKGKLEKAQRLEQKVIQLELELSDGKG